MTQRRSPLRLEELGARVLPSAAPLTPAPLLTHSLVSAPQPAIHALAGHGQGTYTNPVNPGVVIIDAGITYNLRGRAALAALGRVSITGSVHSLGFIPRAHAGGRLTFSNRKGSVTIELTGPEQPGSSPLPQTFDYKVVGRTGAYAHLADQGSLSLVVTAGPAGHPPRPHGTFTLTI